MHNGGYALETRGKKKADGLAQPYKANKRPVQCDQHRPGQNKKSLENLLTLVYTNDIMSVHQQEGGKTMGQTDSQFKAFIRFMLDALKDIAAESDKEKRDAKMQKVMDNLQKTLED